MDEQVEDQYRGSWGRGRGYSKYSCRDPGMFLSNSRFITLLNNTMNKS